MTLEVYVWVIYMWFSPCVVILFLNLLFILINVWSMLAHEGYKSSTIGQSFKVLIWLSMQFSLYIWSGQEVVSYTNALHYLFWLLHPSIWSLYLYWVVLVSRIAKRGGVEVQPVSHQELLTSYFHHAGSSECLIRFKTYD